MQALQLTATALSRDPGLAPPAYTSLPTDTVLPLITHQAFATQAPAIMPTTVPDDGDDYIYSVMPGDTRAALTARFGVSPVEIDPQTLLPEYGYLPHGANLRIPNRVGQPPFPWPALPDSEVVASPASTNFKMESWPPESSGYLASYKDEVRGRSLNGTEIIRLVSLETSVNPRLLLGLLQFRSSWLDGKPASQADIAHPLGFAVPGYVGLYHELTFTATQLNIGYYGWREGLLTSLEFKEGGLARLHPGLNAGSVAIQHLFSKWYRLAEWQAALYGPAGFLNGYANRFGDPWLLANQLGALLPRDLQQPTLELPFAPGERWSFSGGPHRAWNTGTPFAALDFAPVTGEPPCVASRAWALAAAPGVIVRSQDALVSLDLDGDGEESTGWVLIYLHLAQAGRIPAGSRVQQDEPLGHPSCEGGRATGAHLHFARKFNGEWLSATGPVPMVLSGWLVESGRKPYEGYLVKGDMRLAASPLGLRSSIVIR